MFPLTGRRRAVLWGVALSVATLFLVFSFRSVEWGRVWQELRHVRPVWLVGALFFNFAILIFWTLQWQVFLPKSTKVPFRTTFDVIALMAMVSNTIPYMLGHASGVLLLARQGKVGHAVALSVMTLEQLAEGFAKLTVLLAVALLIPIPEWVRSGILSLVVGVGSLSIALLVVAHRFPKPQEGAKRSFRDFVARWAHHLDALRNVRIFAGGLLLGLAMKASEAAAILAVQRRFGVELPLGGVLLVLASVGLATMIGIAPGNLGVYEAAVFLVYQYLGVPPEQALGMAILQHVCHLIPFVGTGYVVLLRKHFPQYARGQSLREAGLIDEA